MSFEYLSPSKSSIFVTQENKGQIDRRTDGQTNGHDLLYRCVVASKKKTETDEGKHKLRKEHGNGGKSTGTKEGTRRKRKKKVESERNK